jgi:hypothetical protein
MKYNRKLTANHYRGANDRLARAIDRMAGLEPDTAVEQPDCNSYRGADREIRSYNDAHYDRLSKNISDKQKERKRLEEIEWLNNSCKGGKS